MDKDLLSTGTIRAPHCKDEATPTLYKTAFNAARVCPRGLPALAHTPELDSPEWIPLEQEPDTQIGTVRAMCLV